MRNFLYEDEITDCFVRYLKKEGWEIVKRSRGRSPGADIIASRLGKRLFIEAKGGGSQDPKSKRYGKPFSKLQCQQNTDVAFASIPRMLSRYKPDYVGIVLHDDEHHKASLKEIVRTIKKIGAGVWFVSPKKVICITKPKYQK
jgi:hypothetical protein